MAKAMGEKERKATVDYCVSRYAEGASIQELADEVGRSYGTVHKLLVGGGVTLRPRGGSRPIYIQTASGRVAI